MANEPDMTAPITRGEMHEALETWAGAIISRFTVAIAEAIEASERRILSEVGRHIRASNEELRAHMSALLEPHVDIPPRVAKLEAVVYAPKPKRKAKG